MSGDPKFAARLRRLMDERGMTASQLARAIYGEAMEKRRDRNGDEYVTTVARNRQLVSAWVDGRRSPGEKNLRMLAKEFRVPMSDLMDDAGGITVSDPDEHGMVLVEMSLRLPDHIGKTIFHIVEEFRR